MVGQLSKIFHWPVCQIFVIGNRQLELIASNVEQGSFLRIIKNYLIEYIQINNMVLRGFPKCQKLDGIKNALEEKQENKGKEFSLGGR
ncbi:MAG: hypothetical protein KJ630_12540 [Proteobacteria bacterium]|nr:hypothetical protein [Pseudomonadota bacterium]